MTKMRCDWVSDHPLDIEYHDGEWGVPLYDDQKLFELLILEGMQAGLNWLTILKKRADFRRCLDGFNLVKMARYDQHKLHQLMQDPSIIRNQLKLKACITNAKAYLALLEQRGSFATFIWQFVDGQPRQNHWRTSQEIPVQTIASEQMSKVLKKQGFKFVGPTICYAFMQATGMVNDHLTSCFRRVFVSS